MPFGYEPRIARQRPSRSLDAKPQRSRVAPEDVGFPRRHHLPHVDPREERVASPASPQWNAGSSAPCQKLAEGQSQEKGQIPSANMSPDGLRHSGLDLHTSRGDGQGCPFHPEAPRSTTGCAAGVRVGRLVGPVLSRALRRAPRFPPLASRQVRRGQPRSISRGRLPTDDVELTTITMMVTCPAVAHLQVSATRSESPARAEGPPWPSPCALGRGRFSARDL